MDIPINYLAILACGVMALALGSLWYGPLFGKPWMKMMGIQKPEKLDSKMKQMMMKNYSLTFIAALVTAYTLAHALTFGNAYLNMSGIGAGLQCAFWYWLGFVVPVALGGALWDGKPWKLFFINAGYWLVSLGLMATIITLWV